MTLVIIKAPTVLVAPGLADLPGWHAAIGSQPDPRAAPPGESLTGILFAAWLPKPQSQGHISLVYDIAAIFGTWEHSSGDR